MRHLGTYRIRVFRTGPFQDGPGCRKLGRLTIRKTGLQVYACRLPPLAQDSGILGR